MRFWRPHKSSAGCLMGERGAEAWLVGRLVYQQFQKPGLAAPNLQRGGMEILPILLSAGFGWPEEAREDCSALFRFEGGVGAELSSLLWLRTPSYSAFSQSSGSQRLQGFLRGGGEHQEALDRAVSAQPRWCWTPQGQCCQLNSLLGLCENPAWQTVTPNKY